MNKVAIFDFDDTLYKGQSHADFTKFLEPYLIPRFKVILYKIVQRFLIPKSWTDKAKKEFSLRMYKGTPFGTMKKLAEVFYTNSILTGLNANVINRLLMHAKNGDLIVIASGGYSLYLEYFTKDYPINLIVSSELQFKNDLFEASIVEECLGQAKVDKVLAALNDYEIDWNNSCVYSDHHSDKALFDLVGNKFVIDIGENLDWVDHRYIRLSIVN